MGCLTLNKKGMSLLEVVIATMMIAVAGAALFSVFAQMAAVSNPRNVIATEIMASQMDRLKEQVGSDLWPTNGAPPPDPLDVGYVSTPQVWTDGKGGTYTWTYQTQAAGQGNLPNGAPTRTWRLVTVTMNYFPDQ